MMPVNLLKQLSMSSILLLLAFVNLFLIGVNSVVFTFTNNCPYKVWPGTLNGAGHPQLSSTGFELESKASFPLDVPASWSGRFWGRSFCSSDSTGKFSCHTADCASGQVSCDGAGAIPPATLIEFTLAGAGRQDYYDISLVDGFNLPVSVIPEGRSGNCRSVTCPADINADCPPELANKDSNNGATVSCKSPCLAFNAPEYCCTGDYGSPEKCHPTKYSMFFKEKCPQAYSYAYDDRTSTFTSTTGANYHITFCP